MKTLVVALALVVGSVTHAQAADDTLTFSYDSTPDISIARLYTDITWKMAEDADDQAAFLRRVDPGGMARLNSIMDSLAYGATVDPHAILPFVAKYGNSRFKLAYVRLLLTKLIDLYRGVRGPSLVRLTFNSQGWLTSAEFRDIAKPNDGFTLHHDQLRPFNFHRKDIVWTGR